MKAELGDDGRRRFILGPVEMAAAALLPSLLLTLLVTNWNSRDAKIDQLTLNMNDQLTQTTLIKEQLRTLSQQLANVPGLNDRVIRVESKVEQNTRDIEELRKVRGLR